MTQKTWIEAYPCKQLTDYHIENFERFNVVNPTLAQAWLDTCLELDLIDRELTMLKMSVYRTKRKIELKLMRGEIEKLKVKLWNELVNLTNR